MPSSNSSEAIARGPRVVEPAAPGVARPRRPGPSRSTNSFSIADDQGAAGLRRPGAAQQRKRLANLAPSKKRRPRTVNAIPACVSASSIGGSWAFIRTSTAVSDGATPGRGDGPDPGHDAGELGVRVGIPADRGRRAGGLRGHERAARTARREPVGELEDLRARAVVVRQRHDPRAGMAPPKSSRNSRRGAGERVDRLVRVAHDGQIARLAQPQFEQPLGQRVRVLVLVHAEPALARADDARPPPGRSPGAPPSRRACPRNRAAPPSISLARSRRTGARRCRPASAPDRRRRPAIVRAGSAAPWPIRSCRQRPWPV